MSGRALQALQALDPGVPRPAWVSAAMGAKAAGIAFDEFDRWSSGAPNYKGTRDCASVWRSISPGGITEASLYAAARANGWQDGHPVRAARRPLVAHPRRAVPPVAPFDFAAVWNGAAPADAAQPHPYVSKKAGLTDDVRVYHGPLRVAGRPLDGALLVPAFDAAGALQAWQAILPDSTKLNAPGTRMAGGRFIVGGGLADDKRVFVCEGIGAAWSAHRATGSPAVCTFGFGNVAVVAADLQQQHPGARIIIVADRGKEGDCQAIARTVGGASVSLPAEWPAGSDINDLHIRDGLGALAQLLGQASEPAGRFKLMTADQLAALPPIQWRVHGVLPADGLAAVFGPSGSGKSFLSLDLLGAVAEGKDWFEHRTARAAVVYVALEGEAGIGQRMAAYRQRYGQAPAGMKFVAQPFALLEPGDIAEFAEAVRAAGGAGGIVCIDTLNRAAPGADENGSADMGRIIAGAKALQAALGGLVLLIHHSGKDLQRGLRGHSSLHAALDSVIEVQRDGPARRWRTAKSKDGSDGADHPFRLDIVELGIDQHGEAVTSCIVQSDVPGHEVARRPSPPGGANMRVALDVIGAMLRRAGDGRPDDAPAELPRGRPAVLLEDVLVEVGVRLVCPDKRRRERAMQAVAQLCSKGHLCQMAGWLWCA
jgi:hypothetical protein